MSGFYLSHPASRYVADGKVDRDQIADYARRKDVAVADVERWLAPVLGYDPEPVEAETLDWQDD